MSCVDGCHAGEASERSKMTSENTLALLLCADSGWNFTPIPRAIAVGMENGFSVGSL